MKQLRIGVIGYKFMGKAHSNAYRSLPMFFQDLFRQDLFLSYYIVVCWVVVFNCLGSDCYQRKFSI